MSIDIKKYHVLYTKNTLKKRKIWEDGILKYNTKNSKAILYDEFETNYLDSSFVKKSFDIGDEFVLEQFIIQIGSESDPLSKNSKEDLNVNIESMISSNNGIELPRKVNPFKSPSSVSAKRRKINDKKRRKPIYSADDRIEVLENERDDSLRIIEKIHNDTTNIDNYSEGEYIINKTLKKNDEEMCIGENISDIKSYDSNLASVPVVKPMSLRGSFSLSEKPNISRSLSDVISKIKENSNNSVSRSLTSLNQEIMDIINPATKSSSDHNSDSITSNDNISKKKGKRGFIKPSFINPYDQYITWNCRNIVFLSQDNMKELLSGNLSNTPKRSVEIKDYYDSLESYKINFGEAIIEDINFQMLSVSQKYHTLFSTLFKKTSVLDHNFQTYFRNKALVPIYFNCELVTTSVVTNRFKKKSAIPQYFLKIDEESKEHYTHYSKDDVWIISSNPNFSPSSKNDLFLIAKSFYHGRSQTGVIEVKPIESPSFFKLKPMKYPTNDNDLPVHCLRGPNISNELSMLNNLDSLTEERSPIINYLLNGKVPALFNRGKSLASNSSKGSEILPISYYNIGMSKEYIQIILDSIKSRYKLNPYQLSVLERCAKWFDKKEAISISPVTLVHGVFGSGKSHMLVVLIIFLCEILETADPDNTIRILVSSATNVAVDRILLGLLENDFVDFLRVGSLKRISKDILPYSIHRERKDGSIFENDRNDRAALRDLQEMLDEGNLSREERRLLIEQIELIKNGNIEKRISLLKQVRVVGATCASTVFPLLEDSKFQIVILDECSQMTEPMSLLPIGKFGCQSLVLVGDPMQLPPTLSSFSNNETDGLGKTLFSRLMNLNNKPIMLKTQYRIHPTLSEYVNKLFYNNKLKNGVTEEDRKPLIGNLSPLLFCDASNGNEKCNQKGSWENHFEAITVLTILNILLSHGISGNQIGIICLYKAQEAKIKNMIKMENGDLQNDSMSEGRDSSQESDIISKYEGLQISTVDAFQGAERDIIIVTCSRTTTRGFIDSPYRTNVALTRAKHHLIVVAHSLTLQESKLWKEVLHASKKIPNGYQNAERIIVEKTLI